MTGGLRATDALAFLALSASLATADLEECKALQRSGHTCVPVRAIFEWLGATVSYHNGVVEAVRGRDAVRLRVGAKTATKNGREIQLATAPFTIAGQCYVPLRLVAEAFGAQVTYDAATRTVSLTHEGRVAHLKVPRLLEYLNPFPRTLDALRGNPEAFAVAQNCAERTGLDLQSYGKPDREKGWSLSFRTVRGPFLLLKYHWYPEGGGVPCDFVLRMVGGSYRYILELSAEGVGIGSVKRAGITPQEWRVLAGGDYWPENERLEEVRNW